MAVVGLVTAGCSGNESSQRSGTSVTGTVADPPGLVRSDEFGPEVAQRTFAAVLKAYATRDYRTLAGYWPPVYREEVCTSPTEVVRALEMARAQGSTPPIATITEVREARSRPHPQATFTLRGRRSPSAPAAEGELTIGFGYIDGAWRLAHPYPVEASVWCGDQRPDG